LFASAKVATFIIPAKPFAKKNAKILNFLYLFGKSLDFAPISTHSHTTLCNKKLANNDELFFC